VLSPRALAARGQRVDHAPDRLVLVIDLDETLVYALRKDRVPPPPLKPEEETPGLPPLESAIVSLGDEQFEVLLRPGAVEFLYRISRLYTVYLYTMGTAEYVQQILPALDPGGEVFRPGQVCTWSPDHDRSTKSLSRVGADPRQVVVVDDALYAWRDHVANLVLISRFVGDRRDSALHVLPQYLRQLHASYFHPHTAPRERDTRALLAQVCAPLMRGLEFTFTGYKHASAEAMREEPLCQLAARFGAGLSFVLRPTTTHLVVRDSSAFGRATDWTQSPKVRQALREAQARAAADLEPVHIVSEQWLITSICSLWPVAEEPYYIVAHNDQPVGAGATAGGAADQAAG